MEVAKRAECGCIAVITAVQMAASTAQVFATLGRAPPKAAIAGARELLKDCRTALGRLLPELPPVTKIRDLDAAAGAEEAVAFRPVGAAEPARFGFAALRCEHEVDGCAAVLSTADGARWTYDYKLHGYRGEDAEARALPHMLTVLGGSQRPLEKNRFNARTHPEDTFVDILLHIVSTIWSGHAFGAHADISFVDYVDEFTRAADEDLTALSPPSLQLAGKAYESCAARGGTVSLTVSVESPEVGRHFFRTDARLILRDGVIVIMFCRSNEEWRQCGPWNDALQAYTDSEPEAANIIRLHFAEFIDDAPARL